MLPQIIVRLALACLQALVEFLQRRYPYQDFKVPAVKCLKRTES